MIRNETKLTQQSRLQQKLNPRQVIFGRYLEMSAPEIEDEVQRQLDENPALEVVSENSHSDNPDIGDSDAFDETSEQLQMADYGNEDDIPAYHLGANNRQSSDYDTPYMPDPDDRVTLIDTLNAQLAEFDFSESDLQIAHYIIGSIDDNGYMTRSVREIADDMTIAEGVNYAVEDIKRVFTTLRSRLDPAGVGAIDLRDCLLLQIDRLPVSLTTKIAREIVADCFDLFSKRHFERLRSHLGIDRDEFAKALDCIKALNPKPGAIIEGNTSADRLRYVIPDFSVEIDANGQATVSLLNNIPELAVEQSFRIDEEMQQEKRTRRQADALSFIKRRHDDAAAFIGLLKMRAETLMMVMKAIAQIQHRFFATGDPSLIRPMIIKDIAAMTGLDISVISRATAGKYVTFPYGIVSLKSLFNERPKDDADASAHEILDAMSQIIDDEDKQHPLSDEAICAALATRGYDLARRTVTKYRERLGQPVARLRKQF